MNKQTISQVKLLLSLDDDDDGYDKQQVKIRNRIKSDTDKWVFFVSHFSLWRIV